MNETSWSPNDPEGCLYPDKCLMPSPHHESECHTVEDRLAQEELLSPFRKGLENLINCHSKEQGSDTPDWILAEYLEGCIRAFDSAVVSREAWYGRMLGGRKGVSVPIIVSEKHTNIPDKP